MIKVDMPEFCNNLKSYILSSENITVWGIFEQIEITYGRDDCNFEYCDTHNIPYYKDRDDGGCIVNFPGTINIANFRSSSEGWLYPCFCYEFSKYLKKKGLNAEYDGNDVLVDGYKVASGFGYNLPPDFKRQFTGLGIFFNTDADLVRKICKKPMVKEPKGLEQYGLTTEECVEWLKEFFNKYNKE